MSYQSKIHWHSSSEEKPDPITDDEVGEVYYPWVLGYAPYFNNSDFVIVAWDDLECAWIDEHGFRIVNLTHWTDLPAPPARHP